MVRGVCFVVFAAGVIGVHPVACGADFLRMEIPPGQRVFLREPQPEPLPSGDPSLAVPLGLGSAAEAGGTLILRVGLSEFTGPVDIYVGLHAPEVAHDLLVLRAVGFFQPASAGLVPWRAGHAGPVDRVLFRDVPAGGLPEGTYVFFLAVTGPDAADRVNLRATDIEIPL